MLNKVEHDRFEGHCASVLDNQIDLNRKLFENDTTGGRVKESPSRLVISLTDLVPRDAGGDLGIKRSQRPMKTIPKLFNRRMKREKTDRKNK